VILLKPDIFKMFEFDPSIQLPPKESELHIIELILKEEANVKIA
jgi:hypothetical protein